MSHHLIHYYPMIYLISKSYLIFYLTKTFEKLTILLRLRIDERHSRFICLSRITTLTPSFRAIPAISSSSVETTTSILCLEAKAVATEYEISGCPAKDRKFFRGIPFDPPRAGMIAIIFIGRNQ